MKPAMTWKEQIARQFAVCVVALMFKLKSRGSSSAMTAESVSTSLDHILGARSFGKTTSPADLNDGAKIRIAIFAQPPMADAPITDVFGGFRRGNKRAAIRAGRRAEISPVFVRDDRIHGNPHDRSPSVTHARMSAPVSGSWWLSSEVSVNLEATVLLKLSGHYRAGSRSAALRAARRSRAHARSELLNAGLSRVAGPSAAA
jgi:hypothetical protein